MDDKTCPNCEEPVIDKQPPCPLSCMSPKCKAYQTKTLLKSQKPIIWILGGPGSGKGTQCEKIVAKYGFTHLSSGDLLRYEVDSGLDRAKCLESIMTRGGLVPNDIVLNLIKEAIARNEPGAKGYLIDGYPREKLQGIEFEKAIAPATTTLETLKKRLMGRAAASGRSDDNEETIAKRIATFMANNQLVLDQFPLKLHRINAEDTKDNIFRAVEKVIDPIMARIQQATVVAAAAK